MFGKTENILRGRLSFLNFDFGNKVDHYKILTKESQGLCERLLRGWDEKYEERASSLRGWQKERFDDYMHEQRTLHYGFFSNSYYLGHLVGIIAMYENHLKETIKVVSEDLKLTCQTENKTKGNPFEKSFNCFVKLGVISSPWKNAKEVNWSKFKALIKLRNFVAHSGGFLNEEETKDFKKKVENVLNVKQYKDTKIVRVENSRITVSENVIEELMSIMEVQFNWLLERINERYTDKGVTF